MLDKVKGSDIPVDEMRRAGDFYKDPFGWEVEGINGSVDDFHSRGPWRWTSKGFLRGQKEAMAAFLSEVRTA